MIAGLAIVALWAFAEAVLWFVVADVPISWLAVRHGWRVGTMAALVAALAAVPGGAIVYLWAANNPEQLGSLYAALPGIDARLVADAAVGLQEHGYAAMLAGSFGGTPYKLYAAAAGSLTPVNGSLFVFLLISFFARVPRFLIVALGTAALSAVLGRWLGMRARLAILVACWIGFYGWYFTAMPG